MNNTLPDDEKRCYGDQCHNRERCGRYRQLQRDNRSEECVVVKIMKHCRDEWELYMEFIPEAI